MICNFAGQYQQSPAPLGGVSAANRRCCSKT